MTAWRQGLRAAVVAALLASCSALAVAQTGDATAAPGTGATGTTGAAPVPTTAATTMPPTAMPPGAAASVPLAAPEPRPDDTQARRARSQPGNNAPFWRAVRESGNHDGVTSLPGAEKGVLIQKFVQYPGSRFTTAGEAWREVRNRWIIPYGSAVIVIVLLAIAIFYWYRGPIGGHEGDTGRVIERFTPFERAAHWSNAVAFVVLAVSGLVMAFGKFLVLPIIGGALFGWLTYALKTLHNFFGPLFAVSLLVVFVTFLRDNPPRRWDLTWLRHGGGMLSDHEVPSHRFNAGEKLVFWVGVFLLGSIVVGSGLVLDQLVPGLAYWRGDMQVAHMIHAAAAVLIVCVFIGHIYIGTIGMRGAYSAMRRGYVDEGWAEEHHKLWYDDIRAGRIPAQRSSERAPAPLAPPEPV